MKSYHFLTENRVLLEERRIEKLWEGVGYKLKEAALSPEQIQQIFAAAESGATAAGGNRTLLGKGKDAVDAVNKAWEDLKTQIQNSGPVTAFDQKVSDILSKIGMGSADPQFNGQVSNWVQKYRDFATQHPVIQGALYATLIAVAGLSGAGIAGAAILGLLKMADQLLQGKRASSAAYAGAKTGIQAYAAGQIGKALKGDQAPAGGKPSGGLDPNDPDVAGFNREVADTTQAAAKLPGGSGTLVGGQPVTDVATQAANMTRGQIRNMVQNQALKAARDTIAQGQITDYNSVQQATDVIMKTIENNPKVSGQSMAMIRDMVNTQLMGGMGNGVHIGNAAMQAAGENSAQLAKTASAAINNFESRNPYVDKQLTLFEWGLNRQLGRPRGGVQLTPAGVQKIFEFASIRIVTEAFSDLPGAKPPQGNTVAPAAPAAPAAATPTAAAPAATTPAPAAAAEPAQKPGLLGRAANWLKTKGKNLTTKITADKLNSAWQKAKSPTDSEQVAQVMQGAGVTPEVVAQAFKQAGVPAPGAPEAPAAPAAPEAPGAPEAPEAPAAGTPSATPGKKHTGGRVAGAGLSQTPGAVKKRAARAAKAGTKAPAGGAGAFGAMAGQLGASAKPAEPTAAPAASAAPTPTSAPQAGALATAPATPAPAEPAAAPAATATATAAPATPKPTAPMAAPGFDYKSIQGMIPKAAPAPAPKAAPNYSAGPKGYANQTMTVKEELVREYEAFLMKQYENQRNNTRRR